MNPPRVVLVGGGRIADMHARGWRAQSRVELYGLCDLDPDVCARRKAEWGLARTWTDYSAVLADPKVDAVEILTPHHLHQSMVVAAAEAGKAVSVQKPMGRDLAECDAMIAACRKAGVAFKVFENFVFHPPYVRARELIAAGQIGTPLHIRTRIGAGYGGWPIPLRSWAWRLDERHSGGGPTIFDDGFHKLSLAWELFGPVVEVTGWIDRTIGLVDSPALLTWRHENGALGRLDAALSPNLFVEGRYYPADERVEIVGSHGTIYIPNCTGRVVDLPPLLLETDGRVEAHTDLDEDWQYSFSACVADFAATLCDGSTPHLTGERGRDITAFALACLEAGRTGEAIAVPRRQAAE